MILCFPWTKAQLKLKLQYFGYLWLPDVKSLLIGKDPDAGKDWGQEEKGVTEDEMVGWHHLLNGHEFNQTLGDSEGQEAWLAAVHGVAKSQTQLSNCAITITTIMIFKCFPINIPLSLFTLSDQFPPVQINWANIKEPGTESMIYARGRAGWPQHQGTYFFFLMISQVASGSSPTRDWTHATWSGNTES